LKFVGLAAVVEGRTALDEEANWTADAADPAVNLMVGQRVRRETYGHEVFDLGDAVFVGEARDEDVCGRPVKLLAVNLLRSGSNLKATSLVFIENRAENAGRVEVG